MSRKERGRLTVMAGVKGRELTLVQAADLMGVCYRQGKRIWKRYQVAGDAGLVHGLRGKPSARRKPPELRAQVLALYAQERYADFGPTLMAEHLAKEKLVVDHETLRRWRLAQGEHTVRRRKQTHRQWRERKPSFGAMVQLDGSHHDWFEGRAARCVPRGPATRCWKAGCESMDCRAACMWIGTASTGAKARPRSPSSWPPGSRRRSLGGRWNNWGWS